MEQTLDEAGFVVEERVLAASDCDDLLRALSATTVRRGKAGARHLMSEPVVAALAADPRLLCVARSALGDRAVPFRATLFEKSGRANWLVVWHQDTALPLETQFDGEAWGPWSMKDGVHYAHAPAWALERIVALRVHLDASTSENGPLRVVPGSHTAGVLSDEAVFARAREGRHVECLVERGGVLAMRPLLIHSSSKVRVERPRRVLHFEYADALELRPGVRLTVA